MKSQNELLNKAIMENQEKSKDLTSTTNKGNGLRFNKGKLRYDLIEPHALEDFVQVLTDGAIKYEPRNWQRGLSWTSVLASLKRHIAAIELGEDYDKESGRLHIAHAACNVHFLNAFYYIFPQGDDRPKNFLKLPKIGLDIDGVICDFTGAWNKLYPETKKVAQNSWFSDRNMARKFNEMKENGTLSDFYMNIELLIRAEDMPFEPHCYVTSRPISRELTEQYLDHHGFPAKPVFSINICESKVESVKNAGIEIFIDDSFKNFTELNNAGIFTYLYTQPHNVKYNVGHMRLNSLKDLPFLV